MPLEIVRKDLSEVTADAVVSFVNSGVEEGAVRVDHQQSFPAGCEIEQRTCQAAVLIEVIMPQNAAVLVARAYRQALAAVVREHCRSVAVEWPKMSLPGISEDELLSIIVQGEREFLAEQELWVTLVVEDVSRLRLSDSLIGAVSQYIEDHYDQALPREKTGHVLAKMKNFIAPVDEDNAADEELQDIPAEEMCLFEEIAEKAPSDDFHGTENTGGESAFV